MKRSMLIIMSLSFICLQAFASTEAGNRPLEKMFPSLIKNLPRLSLIPLETPLESFHMLEQFFIEQGAPATTRGTLWIKRDDLSHLPLGGNKARKLEYLLAYARENHVKKLITFGAWGSNHAYATALAAKEAGLPVELHLGPQPVTDSVKMKLLADFALGANLVFHSSRIDLGLAIVKNFIGSFFNSDNQYIPPGGSNALGTIGYINAMLEVVNQFKKNNITLPDEIIVPMGTAGTSAGLLVGSCLAGVMDKVKIVAVGISHDMLSNENLVRKTAQKSYNFLRRQMSRQDRRLLPECDFQQAKNLEYLNATYPEYGSSPVRTRQIIEDAQKHFGLHLDATYSGKAFAHFMDRLYADLEAGKEPGAMVKKRMFWMTYNSYPLENIVQTYEWSNQAKPWLDLPPAFHAIFDTDSVQK